MNVYQSQAAEASVFIEGTQRLVSLYAFNAAAAKRFVWVFDGDASGPLLAGPFPVESGSGLFLDFTKDVSTALEGGIFVASSTTGPTFTAGGADLFIRVGY